MPSIVVDGGETAVQHLERLCLFQIRNRKYGGLMIIRKIGLAVCLLGLASAANAGYSWNQRNVRGETSKPPAAATHGYGWTRIRGTDEDSKIPEATTRGYSWNQRQVKGETTKLPAAAARGYTWSSHGAYGYTWSN